MIRSRSLTVARKGAFAITMLVLLAACSGSGSRKTVSLIAGDYSTYNDGVGGAARFASPGSIATDGVFLYVCDGVIRKVAIASGEVATIPGKPYGVEALTGGATSLHTPAGIALAAGNLFVCDWSDHTVSRIEPSTGRVVTIAGESGSSGFFDGTGSGARFAYPSGLATDGKNLFVSDELNQTIRRIEISSGEVTTLAGEARREGAEDGVGRAAGFRNPEGLVVQGGDLYLCDSGNNTIRRIVISTGEVTTFAGSAGSAGSEDGTGREASFSKPWSITSDGAHLYVCERDNHLIRRIGIDTAEVTTIAGAPGSPGSDDGDGGNSRFSSPQGICSSGTDLYVSDTGNGTIRKITAAAEVTTIAGRAGSCAWIDGPGSAARFINPSTITSDGSHLYISDCNAVRTVEISSGTVTLLAGSRETMGSEDGTGSAAEFFHPAGLTAVGGYLYVCDALNHTIRWINISTGETATLAGKAGDNGSEDGVGALARFNQPSGIATDGTALYVSEAGNQTIRRIMIETGEVTTLAGKAESPGFADGIGSQARFNVPADIACAGGNLYVADMWNNAVRKIVIATGAVSTLAGRAESPGFIDGAGAEARFDGPIAVAAEGADLYVSDSYNNAIRRIETATGKVSTLAGRAGAGYREGEASTARLWKPLGICLSDGVLFFTQSSCVRRIK